MCPSNFFQKDLTFVILGKFSRQQTDTDNKLMIHVVFSFYGGKYVWHFMQICMKCQSLFFWGKKKRKIFQNVSCWFFPCMNSFKDQQQEKIYPMTYAQQRLISLLMHLFWSESSLSACSSLWSLTIYKVSQRMTKATKWHVCPAKTQISLGILPVWSESSLCTQWLAKNPSFLHANSKDWSDWADAQADPSLRWTRMPFCRFCHALAQVFWED